MTLSERLAARRPRPGRCLLHGYVTERCCDGYDVEARYDRAPTWLRLQRDRLVRSGRVAEKALDR